MITTITFPTIEAAVSALCEKVLGAPCVIDPPATSKKTPKCGTTHHFACDCREAMFASAIRVHDRAVEWSLLSDEGLRLRCGEMTADEIRLARAVVTTILKKP